MLRTWLLVWLQCCAGGALPGGARPRGPFAYAQGNTKYTRLKDLNAGAFGFVVLAKDTETDEAVAIKFMKRSAVNKVTAAAPLQLAASHSPRKLLTGCALGSMWRGKSSTTPSCCT